jgi:hypothetical protein
MLNSFNNKSYDKQQSVRIELNLDETLNKVIIFSYIIFFNSLDSILIILLYIILRKKQNYY